MKILSAYILSAFLLPVPSYAGDFRLSGTLAGKAGYTADGLADVYFPLRVENAPKTSCTPDEEINVRASWGMMSEEQKKVLPGRLKEIARRINEDGGRGMAITVVGKCGGLGDSSFRAKKIIVGADREYQSPGY